MRQNSSKNRGWRAGELVDLDLGCEADPTTKKMMTMVAEMAFCCLQQNGEVCPSMKEVLEVLRSIKGETGTSTQASRRHWPPTAAAAAAKGSPPAPSSRSCRQWRGSREGGRLKWWKQMSDPLNA